MYASASSGTEGSSPASSPASAASLAAAMAAPKFGTLVPNRIFVGGISASTSEAELAQLFSAYGNVKATKIIADRGGVSKGYGFVTFETEEEAKRLQQESECIVLRERKLNIAPAIKKQPFNRSFDGGTGSPPVAPTSTYYYTNGMGIPYQNGMTFYNAGATAPGAAIAQTADPAALYQAAGVFGPQATPGHQTYAPMMYPVPAPSLYMPQQYQYSPMPYEPYFPGTTAAGASFIYTSSVPQSQTGGNGSGNGSSGSTTGAASSGSASGPPSMGPSPPQFQTHFYGPASAHHHSAAMSTSTPHGLPPPMEHIYYSYPPPQSHAQAPPHHGPLALASDQLLVYTTEIAGQPIGNDLQVSQHEESRSTSNHSEQLQTSTTSDSGGGPGGGSSNHHQSSAHSSDPQNLTHKYPAVNLSNRYPNYQSIPQPTNTSLAQQQQQAMNNGVFTSDESTSAGAPPMHHYRIYSTPVYVPPPVTQYSPVVSSPGASLLPTPPPPTSYEKFRSDYSPVKPAGAGLVGSSPYAKGAPLIHQSPTYVKPYGSLNLQSSPSSSTTHNVSGHQKYQPRLPQQQQPHYGKSRTGASHQQQQHQPTFYYSAKACQYSPANARSGQPPAFVYRGPQLSAYALPHMGSPHKGFLSTAGEHPPGPGRRSAEHSDKQQNARHKNLVNSYRGSNLTMSPKAGAPPAGSGQERTASPANSNSGETSATGTTTTATTTNCSNCSSSNVAATSGPEVANATVCKPASGAPTPPPSPYSPTTHPHPTVSPSPNPNQVQLFGSSGQQQQQQQQQQRYNTPASGLSQQQQRNTGSRYQSSSSIGGRVGGAGKSSGVVRQSSGAGGGKYKVNGMVQSGKLDETPTNLGGAGDAPSMSNRLPLTPPGTPQQQQQPQGEQTQQPQIGEACHQMQALSL
ncbi:trithorax group protein osa-like isoform X2 [Copidosoma floridanum]|uniref:trithorax group protein osa-like isoform X2 n=1 Tax=Copidosoma floridanum TaxID=29053 RepID=UPI0006C9923F|nr:trithorax group protein osa-like isoform X2 [Copidosoma floridanum]